jgi:hypothetical protein
VASRGGLLNPLPWMLALLTVRQHTATTSHGSDKIVVVMFLRVAFAHSAPHGQPATPQYCTFHCVYDSTR